LNTIKITAASILAENINAWGSGRRTFYATEEELLALRSSDAIVVKWNHNNGDGTYTHELEYKGYTFVGSTPRRM